MTSHDSQMRFASRVEPPFSGKNASGSVCAQSASACHARADSSSSPRRTPGTPFANLARGPGNLAAALGLDLTDNGIDVDASDARVRVELPSEPLVGEVARGPRVGISVAADRPWRLWVPGALGVSAYRRSPRAPAAPRA